MKEAWKIDASLGFHEVFHILIIILDELGIDFDPV